MSTKSTDHDQIESFDVKNQPTFKLSSPSYEPPGAFTADPPAKNKNYMKGAAKAGGLSRAEYQRLMAAVATGEIAAPKSSQQAAVLVEGMASADAGAAAAAALVSMSGHRVGELERILSKKDQRIVQQNEQIDQLRRDVDEHMNKAGMYRARLQQAELPAELKYKDCADALQSCEEINRSLVRQRTMNEGRIANYVTDLATAHEGIRQADALLKVTQAVLKGTAHYCKRLEERLQVYEAPAEQSQENEQPPAKRARHESYR